MKDALKLNRMWNKGQHAKVLRALAPKGKLDARLLGAMLNESNRCTKQALCLAMWALA